jgi:hypothetical protein
MTAMFAMQLPSETLDADEISTISGCSRKADQVEWLNRNGWVFFKNRAGEPIVGRLYARLKLAGINPAMLATPAAATGGWQPDLSKAR